MRAFITRHGRRHTAIIFILIAFLGLGVTYSIVNPLFESPDEVWHYEYVKYLAEGQGLPVSDLVREMPWHQEGSQPPLYYLLGAGLTFWIDSSDADAIIRYNPHAAVGLADAFDNKNVMAHSTLEAFPYRGTVLAAHLVRLLSVLMGAATVACVYLTALAVLPGQRMLAAVSAAITAFNPQFIFIGASINNDNLVILLCSVAILLLMRIWLGKALPSQMILLGLVAGLTAIAKLNGLVLLPFIALVLIVIAWRQQSPRALAGWGWLVSLPLLAVAGWWYIRNWRLYGDPFGLAAMFAVLPARAEGPTLSELLARAEGVYRSAWAIFGWFNVVAEPWLYSLYTGLTLAGVLGLGVLLIRACTGAPPLRHLRRGDRAGLSALAWLAVWSLVVVAALVGWSQERYPQGRLLFPAISAASVLLATGLSQGGAWLPERWRYAGTWLLVGGLFALAVVAPFRYIVPTYAPPALLADLPPSARSIQIDFAGQAQLLGYEMSEEGVRPGGALPLTLYWQAVTPMDQNYSVFVHLVDDNGLIVAQRDSYPAGGSVITSDWPTGLVVPDHHVIQIPATALAPSQTHVEVGLYDYRSEARLLTAADGDSVSLGRVSILPAESTAGFPNPVYFDFEGQIALVGFELDRQVLHPGEILHLTLYWQSLSSVAEDYTVFTHLLLPPDQVWAQDDAQPQVGQSATSTWQPGQIIEDHHQLTLPAETPPGVYVVEIGLYLSTTGDRLKVGLSDQEVVLGQVRVLEQ